MRRGEWWLSGWVASTEMRPAGSRWLVTVKFERGAVVRNWVATRERAAAQLAEADQLRRPPYPWLA